MTHVGSVGRTSQHCPTRSALAPLRHLMETPNDLPPNVVYDPHAGCRIAQLSGAMVTHDNILSPAAPIDHIAAEDACERTVRP